MCVGRVLSVRLEVVMGEILDKLIMFGLVIAVLVLIGYRIAAKKMEDILSDQKSDGSKKEDGGS